MPRGSAFWLLIEFTYQLQQAGLRRIFTDLLSGYAQIVSDTSGLFIQFYIG